ncbi:MAG: hypothetical protein IJH48_05495 [Oscillospiraceae bacterium]|nr:hypothetical protein [Oscillospiraceae bacterium]
MNDSKFTAHSFMLVFTIIAAIFFFFAVNVVGMASRYTANDFYPIEGTDDLAIRYSTQKVSGIYRGDKNTGTLMLKGLYGFDWGSVADGDWLYLNEYSRSEMGMLFCRVVRVDMNSFEKEVLLDDAILRGRCASGELVCLDDCLMASTFPKTNCLCALYSIASPGLRPETDSAKVLFLDPQTAQVIYSVQDESALLEIFDAFYLEHTLEEVRG